MSSERLVNAALVQAALAKLIADSFGIGARLLHAAGRGMDDLRDAFFYFELDAGRRYKLLTGEDLGAGIGEVDRHAMQPIPLIEEEEE